MDYINETYSAETIFKAAGRIGYPGGRESGDVGEWISQIGWDAPDFAGRCLHRLRE